MAVSVTISPVTQTAEVEVKRASKKGSPLPSFVENPMERRTVPSAITKTKLSRIVRGGFAENFFQNEEIFEVSKCVLKILKITEKTEKRITRSEYKSPQEVP